jgi:hypothetical protein
MKAKTITLLLHILQSFCVRPVFYYSLQMLLQQAQDKSFTFIVNVIDEKTQFSLGGASIQIKGAYHEVIADKRWEFYFKSGTEISVCVSCELCRL